MPKTINKGKRLSGQMRNEYLDRGAFLVEFEQPTAPMDMFRRPVPLGIGPAQLLMGRDLQSATDQYRSMERKGFRVTADTGCLIPEEQYSTYQQGATLKGHQRSFQFFGRWSPALLTGAEVLRNEFGWPISPQISHLCHRRSCCRIDHLIAEEQWRNLKRNYCGFSGECDCGNDVQCIRRYQMEAQADTPVFCLTREEVMIALAEAPPFTVHGRGRFTERDKAAKQRKENREGRKRKQALHQHSTERKQSRLGTIDESDGVA
jgi:hypothetical protein